MRKVVRIIGYTLGSLVGAYAIYFVLVVSIGLFDYVARGSFAKDMQHRKERAAEAQLERGPASR